MRLLAQAAHMSPEHLHRTQQFAQWLLDVGDGVINEENDNITLPPGIFIYPISFLLYNNFSYQSF